MKFTTFLEERAAEELRFPCGLEHVARTLELFLIEKYESILDKYQPTLCWLVCCVLK